MAKVLPTFLHWWVVFVVITISASCLTASGAQWRGSLEDAGMPSEPKTNSWFAFGGAWTGVPTGWNPRDPHGPETFFFSPEFVDLDNGFPQTIVLGDLNKTFILGADDIIVGGDDEIVNNVQVNEGPYWFEFQPLFRV